MAARVSNERAALWQKNLRAALTAWKLGTAADVKVDAASGWEIKRTGLPGVFRFLRAGEWVVFTAGSGTSARATEMLASIKANGRPARPTGAWLDGDVNLARLDGWLPALENFQNLPVAHFSLSNRADYVRTYATLDFPKAHGWKSEPWQVPTNAIRDPLVSFLAVRGIAPVLEGFPPMPRVCSEKQTVLDMPSMTSRNRTLEREYITPFPVLILFAVPVPLPAQAT